MHRYACSIITVLAAVTISHAQPASDIDPALQTNNNTVIRNITTEFVYQSALTGTERNVEVITILNNTGVGNGHFVCFTDNTRQLKSFSGTLLDSSGKVIRKFKRSDLKFSEYSSANLASDIGYYTLEAHAAVYPYTVRYEYEMNHRNGLFTFPTFAPVSARDISLEHARYTVSVPAGLKVRYKCVNLAAEPERTTVDGRDIYNWTIDKLPAIRKQRKSPPLSELVPIVYVVPEEFQYEGTSGKLIGWPSYGAWQSTLLSGRNILPEALKAEVHRLTDHLPSPREKVQALYEYLDKTTRYVSIQFGIGGLQPMTAEEVYTTKFGDCKALTNYLKAMLTECGIRSDYVIIHADRARIFPDFASPSQANHVILRVPLEEEMLWLECTNAQLPFGYIHDQIAGHDAIAILDGTTEFTTLPQYADTLNTLVQCVDVTLAADGSAKGRITERYAGAQYESANSFPKKEPKQQTDFLLSDLRKIPLIQIDSITCREEKTALPSIEIGYTFDAPKYGNASGNRCFVPQNPFSNISQAESGERLYDIDYPAGYSDRIIITLHIPDGIQIESMPKPIRMETVFGCFSSDITVSKGLITIDQRTRMHAGRYPRDMNEQYREFMNLRAKTFNANLVLRKQ